MAPSGKNRPSDMDPGDQRDDYPQNRNRSEAGRPPLSDRWSRGSASRVSRWPDGYQGSRNAHRYRLPRRRRADTYRPGSYQSSNSRPAANQPRTRRAGDYWRPPARSPVRRCRQQEASSRRRSRNNTHRDARSRSPRSWDRTERREDSEIFRDGYSRSPSHSRGTTTLEVHRSPLDTNARTHNRSGSSLAYTRDSPGLNPSENPPCLEPESPGFALPANRVLEHAKASHPRGSEGVSGHTSFSDHPGPCNPEGQMVDSARRIREPCGVLPVSRSEIDTPALEPSDFLQKRELKDDGTVPMFGEDGDLHICNRETPNNARSPKGPQEAADEKDEPSGSCTSSPIAVQEPYQRRANHVYLWEKVYGEERQKEIRECARLLGDKPLFGPKIKPCRSAPRDDKSGSPSQKVNPGGDLGQHKKRRSKNKTNEEHDNDPTSQTGIKEHQNGHPQSKSQQKNPPVRDTLGTGGILNASTQGVEPTRKLVLTSGESLGPELARAGATI